jgi:hypothetical protein
MDKMKMKLGITKYVIIGLSVVAILGCGMVLGLLIPVKAEPQIVTQTVIQEVPVEKIVTQTVEVPVYVDREVPVEKIVTETIEIPVKLKDFQSLDELTGWLAINNPKKIIYAMESIIFADSNKLCCTQALMLQKKATEQGYRLDKQILSPEDTLREYGYNQDGAGHAVCMAWIGKDIYFIEPYEPLNRIWLYGYRGDKG